MLEAYESCAGGEKIFCKVLDPLGREITACWLKMPDGTAVIESAKACGLTLLHDRERDAGKTTTFGVGQFLQDALEHGCTKFYVGLGGSATNDGGAGFMSALGVKILDRMGKPLPPGGIHLEETNFIDPKGADKRLAKIKVILASDVKNPFTGENGASVIFGPQKGADEAR